MAIFHCYVSSPEGIHSLWLRTFGIWYLSVSQDLRELHQQNTENRSIKLISSGYLNIAMENGQFIDDFPIKTSIYKGFSIAMLNNQMVHVMSFLGGFPPNVWRFLPLTSPKNREDCFQLCAARQIWWGEEPPLPPGKPRVKHVFFNDHMLPSRCNQQSNYLQLLWQFAEGTV